MKEEEMGCSGAVTRREALKGISSMLAAGVAPFALRGSVSEVSRGYVVSGGYRVGHGLKTGMMGGGDAEGWFGLRGGAYFDGLETYGSDLSYEIDAVYYAYGSPYDYTQTPFTLGIQGTNKSNCWNLICTSDYSSSFYYNLMEVGGGSNMEFFFDLPWGRHTIKNDTVANTISVDGSVRNKSEVLSYTTDVSVYIGCYRYFPAGSSSDTIMYTTNKMDFYGIKFWRGGVLTRHWVGKERDGVWFPYDKVSGTYATNKGSGTFVGGVL